MVTGNSGTADSHGQTRRQSQPLNHSSNAGSGSRNPFTSPSPASPQDEDAAHRASSHTPRPNNSTDTRKASDAPVGGRPSRASSTSSRPPGPPALVCHHDPVSPCEWVGGGGLPKARGMVVRLSLGTGGGWGQGRAAEGTERCGRWLDPCARRYRRRTRSPRSDVPTCRAKVAGCGSYP